MCIYFVCVYTYIHMNRAVSITQNLFTSLKTTHQFLFMLFIVLALTQDTYTWFHFLNYPETTRNWAGITSCLYISWTSTFAFSWNCLLFKFSLTLLGRQHHHFCHHCSKDSIDYLGVQLLTSSIIFLC